VRVPQDIAIAGFGNLEIAELVPGGLTTVAVPSRQIGAKAGRLILARLAGNARRKVEIDVGFELIRRGSA
jgi:LacI family transcriptional regulator, gluconate utilization system Gnt-I transcriptional repressor